ncbi:MAG: nucleoside recognition domain-containing protein [Clostridia bacterium]|nr:nucleoside recognition domain-containing protein [Clostridia bacterium]MDD4375273.1 nucleoside recognition domain-containing protein [Clostridia bacterium]
MSKIWSFMIVISIIVAIACGTSETITSIIMESSIEATGNVIKLIGMTCFWSGIFNVLEKTSIIQKISTVLTKILHKLFKNEKPSKEALNNISLNVACDMLGVGNAATVYGLKAMEELQKENTTKEKATDNMATFMVLNSASIQIIPTSMITLRAMYNSKNPVEIVPYVWVVSVVALVAGLIACKILNRVIR